VLIASSPYLVGDDQRFDSRTATPTARRASTMSKRRIKTETGMAGRAATSDSGAAGVKQLPPTGEGSHDQAQPADEQHQMIATAAYFLAEHRGFAPGAELEDWLQAESQTMARLSNSGP